MQATKEEEVYIKLRDIYITPDEVFDPFVGIDETLCINANTHFELLERVTLQM